MGLPIVINIRNNAFSSNGTIALESCFKMLLPYDYQTNQINWILTNSVHIVGALYGSAMFGIYHALFYGILFHIIGRIQILRNRIKTVSCNIVNISEKEVREILSSYVQDHVKIIKYVNNNINNIRLVTRAI